MISENSLYLTFDTMIRYIPRNSSFYYSVYINLVEDLTSRGPVSNPQGYKSKRKPKFFTPTEESKKAISFVREAIKRSGLHDEALTIRDNPKHYDIEIVSEDVAGGYKIEKRNGKLYDEWHEHLLRPPKDDDEETFTELK